MKRWVEEELEQVSFKDKRLNSRLKTIVSKLSSYPESSIPQACGDWRNTKATYRFWDNQQVKAEDIMLAHTKKTQERCAKHKTVLAIQDTTDFDFTSRPATSGLGYLERSYLQGLKSHSVLIVSSEGSPLGLIHQQNWARENEKLGKKAERHRKKTKEKESQRWIDSLLVTEEKLHDIQHVVTVADREADIYDLFAATRQQGHDFLIRSAQNRVVNHQKRKLREAIKSEPIKGITQLEIGRRGNRKARIATLSIRYKTLEVQPPQNRRKSEGLQPIPLQVIWVEEIAPPAGEKPINWLLLTTLTVDSFDQALKCLQWYAYRWLIERYHYVLKSGCGLEKLQLGTAERLKKAFATYSMVAWRLLWLTYEARQSPDSPCDSVLESDEWQALYTTIHKTRKVPQKPPSLSEAVLWIARLGGFLARKGDGEPGVKVIWRGLKRLKDIADTWLLCRSPPY